MVDSLENGLIIARSSSSPPKTYRFVDVRLIRRITRAARARPPNTDRGVSRCHVAHVRADCDPIKLRPRGYDPSIEQCFESSSKHLHAQATDFAQAPPVNAGQKLLNVLPHVILLPDAS